MMFSMPNHWQEELLLFLGIILIAVLAGTLAGQLLPCLLLGLLVYLGWHLYQLARLPHLLSQDERNGPRPMGLWKGIVRKVQDLRASHHSRNRGLSWQLDRFRDTVNTLPDAVIILRPSGRIDWSNPAAGKLLDVVWPDSQGRLLTDIVPDPVLGEYLASGVFALPLVITSPVNRAKILSVFITPLAHEADRLMMVAGDITRQYYLDTARRDFVANVSHDQSCINS